MNWETGINISTPLMAVVFYSLRCVQLFCNPVDCSPTDSSVREDSPGKNTGGGCHFLLQGNFPDPGIKPGSPALQVDSLPSEPPGKPKCCLNGANTALIISMLHS